MLFTHCPDSLSDCLPDSKDERILLERGSESEDFLVHIESRRKMEAQASSIFSDGFQWA